MRSTIFLGLMLTGGWAAASFMQEEAPVDVVVVQPIVRAAPTVSVQPGMPVLPLEKMARTAALEPEGNPFASKSWYVPPPLPPVIPTLKEEEPPKPVAPRLPFTYMGRIQEEGGKPLVFLIQGKEAIAVGVGDAVDSNYRLESISPTELVFTYLPLGVRQNMIIGNDLAAMDDSMANVGDAVPTPLAASGSAQ
jgi:hypothetical protein